MCLTSHNTMRNLGVVFDQDLSFDSHLNPKQIFRAALFHLCNDTPADSKCCCLFIQWNSKKRSYSICPVLASLHQFSVISRTEFKVILSSYLSQLVLNGQVFLYIKELIVVYHPTTTQPSQNAGLMVVPWISTNNWGGRAFSHQILIL